MRLGVTFALAMAAAAAGEEAPGDGVTAIAFSRDDTLLAAGWADGTIRIQDVATQAVVRRLQGHAGGVHALAFLPDGTLASAGADDRIRFWKAERDEEGPAAESGAGRHALTALSDGRLAAADAAPEGVRTWDVTGRKIFFERKDAAAGFTSAAASPDGLRVATGHRDGRVRLWDLGEAGGSRELAAHEGPVQDLAFSSDGALLASCDPHQALVWDARSCRLLGRVPDSARVRSVAFSRDARRIAVGSDVVRIRDVKDLEPAYADASAWDALAAPDARAVIRDLLARPAEAVKLLAAKLEPAREDDARIRKLIAALDDDDFQTREKAQDELIALGGPARRLVEAATKKPPSEEVRARSEAILEALDEDPKSLPPPEILRQLRAAQMLSLIGTPEAKALLERLAGGAQGAPLTREAEAALARLKGR